MQFTASAATFLALISHVLAQTSGFDAITKPTSGEVLAAGSTYQVVWDYDSQYAGTVSITLLEGKTATTLELGDTVASGIDNSAGSYTWTVGSDLGDDATYGLKISLDSDPSTFQYSFPFKIEASDEGSSSSSAAASTPVSSPPASSSSAPASSTISIASASAASSSAASTVPESSASESAATTEEKSAATTMASPTTTAAATGADETTAAAGTAAKTTMTSVASATSTGSGSGSSTGSGTSSSASAYATAGAGKVVAGTFAAMGGLAVALFAL